MLSCGCHMYKVNWQIVRLPLHPGSSRGTMLQKQHGKFLGFIYTGTMLQKQHGKFLGFIYTAHLCSKQSKQISWIHLYSSSWMRRIQTNYRLYLYNASWMRRISAIETGPLATSWRYLIAFSLVAISWQYLPAFSPVLSRYLGDILTISALFTIIASLKLPWLLAILIELFISEN